MKNTIRMFLSLMGIKTQEEVDFDNIETPVAKKPINIFADCQECGGCGSGARREEIYIAECTNGPNCIKK